MFKELISKLECGINTDASYQDPADNGHDNLSGDASRDGQGNWTELGRKAVCRSAAICCGGQVIDALLKQVGDVGFKQSGCE